MIFAVLAMVAYLIALHLEAMVWIMPMRQAVPQASPKISPKTVLAAGGVACLLHLISLSHQLISGDGQNFTLVNVASLICLVMSLLATLALPRWKTIRFPISVIYALSMVAVAVSAFVSGSVIKHLAENKGLLLHLALAVCAYALFFIALLYVFQLKWLDKKLKNKQMILSPSLPALMTVERHFFNLTLVAQGLLTIALITGMIYLHNFFAAEHIHKAIFSSLAWLVYSVLLLGQWKLRWRGNRVLIYSISGMILLTFAYFGSRMV